MKKNPIALGLALGAVAAFLAPAMVSAFTTIGGSLGIGTSGNGYQRDYRIWNNAADTQANDNVTPDASHPGALGATLAIWKAGQAWNSNVASAAKNFDFDWQGTTTSSPANANVVFWTNSGCGGGVLAFTETPISDGWRINMCESWIWSDGPGTVPFNQIDIQGVAAHEMGHGLGLGHPDAANPGGAPCNGACNSSYPTMCSFICGTGSQQRDLATDDQNGLGSIYGSIPADKPTITSLAGSFSNGGTLIINGTNFASTVNVKFTAGTSQNTGTIPGVVYGVVPTSSTQISVTIPAAAVDGNVLVWEPTLSRLSNPFPIDINFAPPPPPTLTNVSPATVQAFAGGTITLTGTSFTGATQVNSGGTLLTSPFGFTVVNDTTITYSAPTATALGVTTVNVTTPNGTTGNGSFTYVETNPPKMSAAGFAFQNNPFTWDYAGGAGHTAYLLYALNPATFNYQGFDILSGLTILNVQTLNAVGVGSTTITIAPGSGGITLYSQIATLNGGAFVGASPVTSTLIF